MQQIRAERDSPWRRWLVALAVPLVVAACGAKGSDILLGKWVIDIDKTAVSEPLKSIKDEQARKAALEYIKSISGSLTFEFTKDKLNIEIMGQRREGTWVAKSESGKKLSIDATFDGKTEPLEAEFQGDSLVLGKGAQKFVLKKK